MSKEQLSVELPLGRHLAILTKMYYGALSKRLQKLEIERHYSILLIINESDKKCTQQSVADTLKIDKASMVGVVDYLVKKGYLERQQNPEDRREYWLTLTPKATETIPLIQQHISELNKIALDGLTENEINLFNKTLCNISANLNKLPSDRVFINYKKAKTNE